MASTGREIDNQPGDKQMPSGHDSGSLPPIHRNAVITLAGDMRISVDRAHKLYCIVLERLAKEARIRDYLPILVTKKVRFLMRKKLEIQDRLSVTEGLTDSRRPTSDEQR